MAQREYLLYGSCMPLESLSNFMFSIVQANNLSSLALQALCLIIFTMYLILCYSEPLTFVDCFVRVFSGVLTADYGISSQPVRIQLLT